MSVTPYRLTDDGYEPIDRVADDVSSKLGQNRSEAVNASNTCRTSSRKEVAVTS